MEQDELYDMIVELHNECKGGKSNACVELGKLYLLGKDDVAPNPEYAIRYLEIGCERGNGSACLFLSAIAKDENRDEDSITLLNQSQRLFYDHCMDSSVPKGERMDDCVLYANNVLSHPEESEIPKAVNALKIACQQGDTGSCIRAGEILIDESYNHTDRAEGLRLLGKACKANDPEGCFILGTVTYEDDPAGAQKSFEKSCDMGSVDGCLCLGDILSRSGKYQKALEVLKTARDQHDRTAWSMSGWLENARGNKKSSFKYFTKACTLGDDDSCSMAKQLSEFLEKETSTTLSKEREIDSHSLDTNQPTKEGTDSTSSSNHHSHIFCHCD